MARAPIVEDDRLPMRAAASSRGVYLRTDATDDERRRAIAIWYLSRTGTCFTAGDVEYVENLFR